MGLAGPFEQQQSGTASDEGVNGIGDERVNDGDFSIQKIIY